MRSQDITLGYVMEKRSVAARFVTEAKDIPLLHDIHTDFGVHTSSCEMDTGVLHPHSHMLSGSVPYMLM
jgi:hypothetical protein